MTGKISVVFRVSPWDEETDIKKVEERVRSISKEGLHWGDSKNESVFGDIKVLKILAVIEPSVSVDEIEQEISDFDDLVQVIIFFYLFPI
ncbi:elongation factor 1b-related protein [Dictyostelium discoideum AX4]|uniref:Elongation factor 1b-related protein n=1 Tax=Dictyostelium discoideum TaxID=44689 RepID=Q54UZ9_DICDI|nr:elongation factor 1b-related protein [Dictyostelium discoideum AX4]EAL67153.1 elongation factor 1b-related protein [Dictyostelium discoideum AX4]|eukprot:XP_641132.1 elongation factor 1b-related protein [Dictyostelium discoideum AX4]